MNGKLSTFVRRSWVGQGGVPGYLLSGMLAPASWVYGSLVSMRNRVYDRRGGVRVRGLRVVSVGNLAVGGTGKTPFAAWIARFLSEHGTTAAIVSRGYGRDELLLHRRWNPQVHVEAHPDRVLAAERARDAGVTVVVLDDGFQHRRLARDLDLVLLAAEDPFPGRLLPTGPYRETAASLARADVILVTRRTASSERALAILQRARDFAPSRLVGVVRLAAGGWLDLGGKQIVAPSSDALVVAAVARPEDFRENVAVLLGREVALLAFPDHHEYRDDDIRRITTVADGRSVVMTEKDAVKLAPWASELPDAHVLTQRIVWESGRDELEMRISEAVGGLS
jgi:tetraacyldisaccharide 4'-kinase